MQEVFVPRQPAPSLLITPCLPFTFKKAPIYSSQAEEGKVRTLKSVIIPHFFQVSNAISSEEFKLTVVVWFNCVGFTLSKDSTE